MSTTCPHCKNPIEDEEALLCHFCGESLQKASSGALGKLRYANNSILWIFIILMIIFGFVMVFIQK